MRRISALLLATLLASCGGSNKGDSSQQERNVQKEIGTIRDRLTAGPWKLVGYAPDTPLEPFLQQMLEHAKGHMTVKFTGNHLVVDLPPTIHFDHVYEINDAYGEYFTMTTTSDTGAKYVVKGRTSDDARKIEFHGETAPFRGSGMLERMN
jgi:hypothetical protein